jgi:hypothetical protein
MSTIKKLAPMWSIPRRISTRKVNSYTLEMLTGTPLNGEYHARRLRAFQPQEGTKLALSEAAQQDTMNDENTVEEGDGGTNEELG